MFSCSGNATMNPETVYLIPLIKRKSFLGLFIHVFYGHNLDSILAKQTVYLVSLILNRSNNSSVHMKVKTIFI